MPQRIIDELRATLFRRFLPIKDCKFCRYRRLKGKKGDRCNEPTGISEDGLPCLPDSPSCFLSWDYCPTPLLVPRMYGQGAAYLSDIIAWQYEKRMHTEKYLSCGADTLLLDWYSLREMVEVLALRKDKIENG